MTLEGYLEQIRQGLMDADGLIYEREALIGALRHALCVYNRDCPDTTVGTACADEEGRTASLDNLARLVDVLEVMEGDSEVRGWVQYSDGSSASLLLAREFEPGAELRVRYTRPHTINGLDGAEVTSVPAQDENLLVNGAAGYAACGRAGRRVQGFDPLPAGPAVLEAWGRAALEEFRAEVHARQSRAGTIAAWD